MPQVGRKLRRWTARLLELPEDVVLDLPRVTLIGRMRLMVENHTGVLHFSSRQLRLATVRGALEIDGRDLVIRTIGAAEVIVEGEIDGVRFQGPTLPAEGQRPKPPGSPESAGSPDPQA
jgi:sporulation protein YqfC